MIKFGGVTVTRSVCSELGRAGVASISYFCLDDGIQGRRQVKIHGERGGSGGGADRTNPLTLPL